MEGDMNDYQEQEEEQIPNTELEDVMDLIQKQWQFESDNLPDDVESKSKRQDKKIEWMLKVLIVKELRSISNNIDYIRLIKMEELKTN
jgi:hypothetical protein